MFLPIFAVVILTLFPSMVLCSPKEKSPHHDDPFHHIVTINPRGDFVVEWTVNWSNRTVTFKATARTLGYVSIGFSRKGSMSGDAVIGGVAPSGEPYLVDVHVPVGDFAIRVDDTNDYTLHSAWENATHTSVTFSRAFDTCDLQDYIIGDNTIWIIWAYSEVDDVHSYHFQNRGNFRAHILDPVYTPREIQEARRTGVELAPHEMGDTRKWTVSRRQEVPTRETTYWCSINKGPVLEKKHHLIGFEFRYESDVQFRINHHLILFKCRAPEGEDPHQFFQPYVQDNTGESCYFLLRGESGRMPTQYCREVVFPYGIGGRMFFLPDHVGIPIGDSPDEYYLLQVHYDNPSRTPDILLDINIDLYYTPNLREHEAGVATIGHHIPGSPSILIPPSSRNHSIYGHCGSSCTNEMLPPEGINIFGVLQHTHNAGVRHRFRHFRGNTELPWITDDPHYDNRFQPVRMTRTETNILPGDHLTTECGYDNAPGGTGRATVGGFGTREEMCLVYIWYYNRLPNYSLCRSEISDKAYNWKYLGVKNLTWSDPDLEYVVADPGPLNGLTVAQVASDRIEWTRAKRAELQKDHKEWTQINHCDRLDALASSGEREPKYVGYPTGVREYRRRDDSERICRERSSE